MNCCGLSSSDCNEKKKDLSYVNCNKIDTLNNKVDTITNRLDELICELEDTSKYDDTGKLIQGCIDKNRTQNCKI